MKILKLIITDGPQYHFILCDYTIWHNRETYMRLWIKIGMDTYGRPRNKIWYNGFRKIPIHASGSV